MKKLFTAVGSVFGIDDDDNADDNKTSHSNDNKQKNGFNVKISTNDSNNYKKKRALSEKICIGDKVMVKVNKLEAGTIKYIGYPFDGHSVRYGIDLDKAHGENDGSLYVDIKTGKVVKKQNVKKHHKNTRHRKFFQCKTKHGVFVKQESIQEIYRKLSSSPDTRFAIDDEVEVRFRGRGYIKFIGNLEHTKDEGIWYGIELKERKGRHDGTVNGVKYFKCKPQYGLHCRQNHLTLIKHDRLSPSPSTPPSGAGDESSASFNKNKNRFKNGSSGNKTKPMKGFKSNFISARQIPLNGIYHQRTTSDRIDEDENSKYLDETAVSWVTVNKTTAKKNRLKPVSELNVMTKTKKTESQLHRIIPVGVFSKVMSVDVLAQPTQNKQQQYGTTNNITVPQNNNTNNEVSVTESSLASSVKKGNTMAVLPGYEEHLKQIKFFDYYDFDEIEDELGDGEFGVVYKCRKIEQIEENELSVGGKKFNFNEDDESRSGSQSISDYPGDDSDDSLQFPGDNFSDDSDDEKNEKEEEIFAVKKIKKAKFHHLNYRHKEENIKLLQQEIKLLEKVVQLKKRNMEGSQYVIDLIDVFEDRNYIYIVTNFCSGGNLWTHVESAVNSNDTQLTISTESEIQNIMKQILEGLAFLHRHNVAHLDLKPDNIMFDKLGKIQLIDFGMSRMIPPLHKAGVLVGTPNFVAPEVIEGFYDKKADVWSAGIIFFMLRFGYPPFFEQGTNASNDDNKNVARTIGSSTMDVLSGGTGSSAQIKKQNEELFDQIKRGFFAIEKEGLGPWFPSGTKISDKLKDLISKMLERDLAKRLTAAECLQHPYFSELVDDTKLPLTVMTALTTFSGQCKFKVLISRLFAHQIEPDQFNDLREIWNQFDTDHDGNLTMTQFKSVMSRYNHGYKDYQIEAMFESLDWNETEKINFNSLLTAYSYQRLVAVDERLWEAFAKLDVDNDGLITKAEIKRVLAMINPDEYDVGIECLAKQPSKMSLLNVNQNTDEKTQKKKDKRSRRDKNLSVLIGDCLVSADWDDDGQIDYEEFLRALHPRFNEQPVTPKEFNQSKMNIDSDKKFLFQNSFDIYNTNNNHNDDDGDDEKNEINNDNQQKYNQYKNNINLNLTTNASALQETKSAEFDNDKNNSSTKPPKLLDHGSVN